MPTEPELMIVVGWEDRNLKFLEESFETWQEAEDFAVALLDDGDTYWASITVDGIGR